MVIHTTDGNVCTIATLLGLARIMRLGTGAGVLGDEPIRRAVHLGFVGSRRSPVVAAQKLGGEARVGEGAGGVLEGGEDGG